MLMFSSSRLICAGHVNLRSALHQYHAGRSLPIQIPLNTHITNYMRNGLVDLAQNLFDEMPHRNTVTWNSMIRGYFLNGDYNQAVCLFNQMPDPDIYSFNTMIAGLMHYGNANGAKLIFDRMPVKDVISWNSMIVGYVRNSLTEEALYLFNEMPQRNVISWNTVMAMLVNCRSFELAESLFNEMPVRDIASWTVMITALLNQGRIFEARRMFDDMPEKDVRVWNTMMAGYIESGRTEIAESLFIKMPERDLDSWNELIDGLASCGRLNDAMKFFTEIPQRSPRSWNSILFGLIHSRFVEVAHAIFEKNPFSDVVAWTNLVVGYFEIGNANVAVQLFDVAPVRDEALWNAAIFGLGGNDRGEEGLKLYLRMMWKGITPDHATFTSILNICSILPSIHFGKQAHGQIIKLGFDRFISVSNAIITMYARCGSIKSAQKAFSYMPCHDTISWNSIICGFSHHGNAREALKFFELMRSSEAKLDQITFIGVLSACSHAGLVDEGRYCFNLMRYKHFLQPTSEHYTCMVDLLGRFGYVEEALKFICGMEENGIEASVSVWGALLRACRMHGNVVVGEVVGRRVLEMEPWNAVAYMMLADLYLAVGRRRDAEVIWVRMKDKGVKKQPGCSWIEVKNKVDVFLAGDGSHPEIDRVYEALNVLYRDIENGDRLEEAMLSL